MGVSINDGGVHKWGFPGSWMVYFMENLVKMDDLGVAPFWETSMWQMEVFDQQQYLDLRWAMAAFNTPVG